MVFTLKTMLELHERNSCTLQDEGIGKRKLQHYDRLIDDLVYKLR